MKSCGYLQEYTIFVGKVKEYKKEYKNLDVAIEYAIDYCIEHNVMKELLLKHKAEVARLIFREFDEAEYMRQLEKEKEATIAAYKEKIALQEEQISQKDKELLQKAEQLAKYKLMLEEHGIFLSEE